MAKEICAYCKHYKFTTIPHLYAGYGGWCYADFERKGKIKDICPLLRKRFCRKFVQREEHK